MLTLKDLKKDQYYRYIYPNSNYLIGKCNTNGNYICSVAARTKEMYEYEYDEFFREGNHSFSAAIKYEPASQQEINWLEKCIKENKLVPFIINNEIIYEIC